VSWLFNPEILRFLAGGLGVTLGLAALSIALSFVAGTFLALARLSPLAFVRWPAIVYIEVVRALPVLLIVLFAYLGLPNLVGVKFSPFTAAVIALTAFTAALVAEIVRAGILSVPRGVVEAAESQALSGAARLRLIVLPIALRRMTPALTAQFVTLLKDTSLTAVIGNLDLLRRGQIVYSEPPFQPFPVYLLVAAVYFAVNFGLSQIARRIERGTV
jgi:putative glutamine transport system permease protein